MAQRYEKYRRGQRKAVSRRPVIYSEPRRMVGRATAEDGSSISKLSFILHAPFPLAAAESYQEDETGISPLKSRYA